MRTPGGTFSEETIQELIERTSKGEGLIRITSDPHMPSRTSVYEWIEEDGPKFWPEFSEQFRDARARGVHALAEQTLDIADRPDLEPQDKRVRIDTRLRLAGKWLPSIYGDKVDVTSGNKPIRPALSDREIALAIFKMAAIAKQQKPLIEAEYREGEGEE